MTVQSLLAEPGRVDEPQEAKEYSDVLSQVIAEGKPVIVRRNGEDLAAVIPLEHLALLREVARGEDFFRSAVIEALGDYKASYAVDAISAISKLDGPLQDDAALALGKIGAPRALETLAGLQQSAEFDCACAGGFNGDAVPADRAAEGGTGLAQKKSLQLGMTC